MSGAARLNAVSITFAAARGAQQLALNDDLLAQLESVGRRVRQVLPGARPLAVGEVLRWPGIFGEEAVDQEALVAAALDTARQALDDFAASHCPRGRQAETDHPRARCPHAETRRPGGAIHPGGAGGVPGQAEATPGRCHRQRRRRAHPSGSGCLCRTHRCRRRTGAPGHAHG